MYSFNVVLHLKELTRMAILVSKLFIYLFIEQVSTHTESDYKYAEKEKTKTPDKGNLLHDIASININEGSINIHRNKVYSVDMETDSNISKSSHRS